MLSGWNRYTISITSKSMSPVRKVAFVATYSSACVHRRMRGALSYADAHPQTVVRDFRLPPDFADTTGQVPVVTRLEHWQPDGMLCFMEDRELNRLLNLLSKPIPIVSMAAVKLRPGDSPSRRFDAQDDGSGRAAFSATGFAINRVAHLGNSRHAIQLREHLQPDSPARQS